MQEVIREVKQHREQDESSGEHAALPGALMHAPATRWRGGWAWTWPWPRRHRLLTAGVFFVLLVGLFAWQLWLRNLATPSSPTRQMQPVLTPTPIIPVGTPHAVYLTVADSVVYAGANQGVYALRAGNGLLLWKQQTKGSIWQVPLVVDCIVYVLASSSNDGQGTLYALRTSDGQQLWRFPLRTFSMPPAVEQGVVYLATPVDGVVALRASDGYPLWHTTPAIPSYETRVADGVVYVSAITANNRSTLYALRADNGSLLWRYPIVGSVLNQPLLVGNVLYVGSNNGIVFALDPDVGKLLWHYQTGGA